jgi:hypothetical protein
VEQKRKLIFSVIRSTKAEETSQVRGVLETPSAMSQLCEL